MKMVTKRIVLSVLLATLTGPSMAEVVFTDDFSDGNRDGWFHYAKNTYSSLAVVDQKLELKNANYEGDTENNFAAVRPFAAATMLSRGDKITLELDFRALEKQTQNRGVSFGLYDSQGTAIDADTSSGTLGDNDSGWFTHVRRNAFMHRLYENNNKGILETAKGIAARADDDHDAIRVGGVAGTGASIFGVDSGTWYTYRLEIEAVEGAGGPADEVDHLVTATFLKGANTLSTMTYTDRGSLVGSFDQVGVISTGGNNVAIDTIRVTYDAATP